MSGWKVRIRLQKPLISVVKAIRLATGWDLERAVNAARSAVSTPGGVEIQVDREIDAECLRQYVKEAGEFAEVIPPTPASAQQVNLPGLPFDLSAARKWLRENLIPLQVDKGISDPLVHGFELKGLIRLSMDGRALRVELADDDGKWISVGRLL